MNLSDDIIYKGLYSHGFSVQSIMMHIEEDEVYQDLIELLPHSTETIQASRCSQMFTQFQNKLIEIDSGKRPLAKETKAKVIDLLSRIIHYCHREEVVNLISRAISKFTDHLSKLQLKQPPQISKWPVLPYKELRFRFKKLDSEKLPEVYKALDSIFLSKTMIQHLQWMLMLHPEVFLSYRQVDKFIDSQTTIPTHEKIFLAIIAVSNVGCLYMWNRLVNRFFWAGGDRTWITKGLEVVPKHIHLLAQLSEILTHNPKILVQDEKYFESYNNLLSKQYVSEAIHLLCYYQSLACYCLVLGLNPEFEVDEKLINVRALKMVSRMSVENVYRRENSKEFDEVRTGENLLKDYIRHFDKDSDEEYDIMEEKRAASENFSLKDLSPNKNSLDTSSLSSNQEITTLIQNNSKTYSRIKKVFGKWALFDGIETEQQTEDLVQQLANELKQPNPRLRKGENYSIVHAAQWSNLNTASILEDYFSQNNAITTVFIKFSEEASRLTTETFTKKKSKEIQYYYQFLCHYMHMHVNYKKLISEDLTQDEKFLIKIITKSPYLLGEAGLEFFKEKEKLNEIKMNDLEVITLVLVAARMEVLINITMRNFSNFRSRFSN